jgi:hypothetical protein
MAVATHSHRVISLRRGNSVAFENDSVAKVPKTRTVIFSAETYTSESRY